VALQDYGLALELEAKEKELGALPLKLLFTMHYSLHLFPRFPLSSHPHPFPHFLCTESGNWDDEDSYITTTKLKRSEPIGPKSVVMDEELLNPMTAAVRPLCRARHLPLGIFFEHYPTPDAPPPLLLFFFP
jgi:hypothetical protein